MNSPYLLVYEFLQFVDIFWKYKEHEIFIEKNPDFSGEYIPLGEFEEEQING